MKKNGGDGQLRAQRSEHSRHWLLLSVTLYPRRRRGWQRVSSVLGGASPAHGDDADARICQNSSEGNKQWPSNHAEVMDRVMIESLKGTPSGSCPVIIHSQYLEKKIYPVIGSCIRGPQCPRRASSAHRTLLHLRCYLGERRRAGVNLYTLMKDAM